MDNPVHMMIVAMVGLVLGVLVPCLMILRVIEPSFILSFLAYGASIGGLFLGLFGIFTYVRVQGDKEQDPWDY